MKTIAIVNRKGGVGKTATAQALGAGLRREGYRILFIDLDSQHNLTHGTGASANGLNSMDVLTGRKTALEAIQHTGQGDIIAGSEALAGADAIIDGTGKEYRLKEALEEIGGVYDFAVIDTPAALGTLTVNALTAANTAVVPVQPDIYSLQGFSQLNEAIRAVKKYCNHNLTISGILITRFSARSILSRDMRENFEELAIKTGTRVFSVPIRECVKIREAQTLQQDIFEYAPRSNAAKDYAAFVREFLELQKNQ